MDVEYAESIISPILQYPEKLEVYRKTDERGVLLTLNLSPEDVSIVIGRKGKTIEAIRTIMRCYGAKNGAHISVKINEPTDEQGV